jgi:MurNAc alpha-1-phosphate uridylyltransferase
MEDAARFPDVMLLAAGLGTRLMPLTAERPKPLTAVGGTALIDRVVAVARFEGATRFAVNAHHLADQMVAHFSGHPDFSVLREPELLGTGGGLRNALSTLTGDPLLVMNTDAFWPVGRDRPLARLLARHAETGAEATLLCAHPARAHGFGRSHDFCLDPGGRITNDFGLPVIYAGVALVGRGLFADEDAGAFSINRLFERAEARETLFGVLLDAPWYHVGDAEGLAAAEAALR